MRRAKIVIGCSYGDEGKGLAAAFLAGGMEGPCLNVLINGGAQRGHTVDLRDGRRHVFRHFGACTLSGGVSLADADYLVNPLLFAQEREELREGFGLSPRLIVSRACRVSTPYDMMLGQIIEENRGRARHGSCGVGIYETIRRFETASWSPRWGDILGMTDAHFAALLGRIAREYLPERLRGLGMGMDGAWREAVSAPGLAEAFLRDTRAMEKATESCGSFEEAARDYGSLVFEAGQGLALDAENREDFPYLTPSRTTSEASARRIAALAEDTQTEVVYVTRTYLTRHGPGPLPGECPREAIGENLEDRTNVPNPHQLALRYAPLDAEGILRRTGADRAVTEGLLPTAAFSIMVTHLNETHGRLTGTRSLEDVTRGFDRVYLSDCPWGARRAG